jgi:hypothetical protein
MLTRQEEVICSILHRASKKDMPYTHADRRFLVEAGEMHWEQIVRLMEKSGTQVDRLQRIALALGGFRKGKKKMSVKFLPIDMLQEACKPCGELIPEDDTCVQPG